MDLLIVAIFAALAFLGLATQLWGVDTRPGFCDAQGVEPSHGMF
jgi:hypothetical protein